MKHLFILLCIFLSTNVFAEKLNLDAFTIGKTVAGRGEFFVERNNSIEKIGLTENLVLHDIIITSEKSFVVIQFTDGTKLTVRPNSRVKIEEYSYYGDRDVDRVEISVLEGGLRMITGAITKNNPDNFTVRTPVALMGVRGTEFSLMLCGENICSVEEVN